MVLSENKDQDMSETALLPAEQKTVLFYQDEITAVRLASGEVFIPLRPIVEGLGIDWASQTRRINRDPILAGESRLCVVVTTTQTLDSSDKIGSRLMRRVWEAQSIPSRSISGRSGTNTFPLATRTAVTWSS